MGLKSRRPRTITRAVIVTLFVLSVWTAGLSAVLAVWIAAGRGAFSDAR